MAVETKYFASIDSLRYFKTKQDAYNLTKFAQINGTINGVAFDGTSAITVYDNTKLSTEVATRDYLTKADAATTYLGINATAAAATKLATAVRINGIAFDGTENITVADDTKLGLHAKADSAAEADHATAADSATTATTATSAGKLTTAVNINGVAFDGSTDITINAVDATARIAVSEKGVANGVATLDANGLVPSSQLPSYVDDVKEFASQAGFPAEGETDKIYVATDTGNIYRWSGSQYIQINSAVSTADHAVTADRLATPVTINGVSFDGSSNITVADDTKLSVTTAQADYLTKADAASTYVAQETGKGLSSNDFTSELLTKLNGIEAGANAYVLPQATVNTLGGVTVGQNISVSEGTISVTSANVIAALGYTPSDSAQEVPVDAITNAEIDALFTPANSGN